MGGKNVFSNKAILSSNEYEKFKIITSEPKWNLNELKKANVKYIISTIDILGYEKLLDSGSLNIFKV